MSLEIVWSVWMRESSSNERGVGYILGMDYWGLRGYMTEALKAVFIILSR